MKILLLFIPLFISTSVFSGEHKGHDAGVKDEWHKDKVVDTKKNSAGAQIYTSETFEKTRADMHQGAMNSVRPQKPGSSTKVWTNGSASSVKKPTCSMHDSVHC